MGIINKLLVAGVAGLVIKGISAARNAAEEEQRRQNTKCDFDAPLTEDMFKGIAIGAARKIKGKKIAISVEGPVVKGTVRSQSGLTTWCFTIDFNDYGEITGQYWIHSENDDSLIPKHIADTMQESITCLLND